MLLLYVCILYPESLLPLFLSASIASESPMNLRVCVCSVGCGCDQCLRCCCISSLHAQSLFNVEAILRSIELGEDFEHCVDKWKEVELCLSVPEVGGSLAV